MKLIVGLGNPGTRYQHTRHNVGYMVIDALAREVRCAGWSLRCESQVAEGIMAGGPVTLAKPVTYMNASGRAVRLLLDRYGAQPGDLIVIFDDLDLPVGRIRIRERGSAGGHHGMESIIGMLESEEFIRIRLGIGEDDMPEEKAEFVLAEIPPGRTAEWDDMIARAVQAVSCVVACGATRAMSLFNA